MFINRHERSMNHEARAFHDRLPPNAANRHPSSPHKTKNPHKAGFIVLVPGAGIEPARCCHRWILSPVRLPVPPSRHSSGEPQIIAETRSKSNRNLR
jgi:hypothetical protein